MREMRMSEEEIVRRIHYWAEHLERASALPILKVLVNLLERSKQEGSVWP